MSLLYHIYRIKQIEIFNNNLKLIWNNNTIILIKEYYIYYYWHLLNCLKLWLV